MLDIICGFLILLFAYTAFSKILAFGQFRFVLRSTPLTGNYSTLLAVLIPAIELIVVLLLLLSRTNKACLIRATILLIVFTTYLIFIVLKNPDLPCSYGGVHSAANLETAYSI